MPCLYSMTTLATESDHDRLVQALARHIEAQTGQAARVIQTHISSVILCGDVAYKLKRPVKLAFLDFSNLESRYRDCEAEWRINQRTAPALYLSVEPITGSLQAPEINGPGPAIDWLLRMRRFPQESLLSDRLQAGQLSTKDIDGLADHLAAFHKSLPALPEERLAGFRPTAYWIEESLQSIAAFISSESEPVSSSKIRSVVSFETEADSSTEITAQIDTVSQFAKKETQRLTPTLLARRKQGFFRECHGDLHLANIVKLNGQFVAFDALEFDDELRNIDVMNDLAFPFMDLMAHGRGDLAWRMISRIVEHTGDYEGLVLLRYYALYRACVRAKVALLSKDHEKFQRYWSLVLVLAQPQALPRLTLVGGFSGSGKSTAAQMAIETIGGVRIRADVERKRLFAQAHGKPQVLYSPAASQATYTRLSSLARTLLSTSINVVVDATFLEQEQVNVFARLMGCSDWAALAIICQSTVSSMQHRIAQRKQEGNDPSDATPAVLAQQIQKASPPLNWPCPCIHITNTGTLDDLRAAVESAMLNQVRLLSDRCFKKS